MASRSFKQTLPQVRLSAASALSLLSHIKFLEYLTSDKFYQDYKDQFQNSNNLRRIQKLAFEQVSILVYDKYTPKVYERTDNARNSLKAVPGEGTDANITLYSDPQIAPAVSEHLPNHSYLAFFEKAEFHSFLFDTLDAGDVIRPFFGALEAMMLEETSIAAKQAYETIIRSHLPT